MCGRTACTLNPDQISRAARYRNSKGRDVDPKWRDGDQSKYRPSYNKAPMSYCPVLLHVKHLEKGDKKAEDAEEEHERVIVSMKWGLIPTWVKDPNQAQYKMNNARSDTMLTKASYKRPLEKGQRCVLLVDGFYEWNTTKSEKQPYYIFFKDTTTDQKTKIDPDKNADEEAKNQNVPSDISNNQEKRIVTMAGIFESRKSENPDEDDLFTFSVITVNAHPEFSWLHHRMPAMLENEEEVRRWLDYGEVPLNDAIELIKPKGCLDWYPVSKIVNNSRNNVPECLEKINLSKEKQARESKGMAKWLASADSTKSKSSPSNARKLVKNEPTSSPGESKKRSGSSAMMDSWLKKAKKA